MEIGSAHESTDFGSMSVVGKDLLNGIPKTLTITSQDVREAIEEPVEAIVDAVEGRSKDCRRSSSPICRTRAWC